MPMKKAGRQGKQLRKTEGGWEWLKNYRIWDANRKIFVYPENWTEPRAAFVGPFSGIPGRSGGVHLRKMRCEGKAQADSQVGAPEKHPRSVHRQKRDGRSRRCAESGPRSGKRPIPRRFGRRRVQIYWRDGKESEARLRCSREEWCGPLFRPSRCALRQTHGGEMTATIVTPISRSIISSRESKNTAASRPSPLAIALRSTMRYRGGFISLSASRHEDNRADQLLRCNSGVWFIRKWSPVRLQRADGRAGIVEDHWLKKLARNRFRASSVDLISYAGIVPRTVVMMTVVAVNPMPVVRAARVIAIV